MRGVYVIGRGWRASAQRVLGRGAVLTEGNSEPTPHQLWYVGECCKLLSGVRGGKNSTFVAT